MVVSTRMLTKNVAKNDPKFRLFTFLNRFLFSEGKKNNIDKSI